MRKNGGMYRRRDAAVFSFERVRSFLFNENTLMEAHFLRPKEFDGLFGILGCREGLLCAAV